jgi:hypothetical protein
LRRLRWTGKQIVTETGVSPFRGSRVLYRLGLKKLGLKKLSLRKIAA